MNKLVSQWDMLTQTRDWLAEQYENPNNPDFYHQPFVLQWRQGVDDFIIQDFSSKISVPQLA